MGTVIKDGEVIVSENGKSYRLGRLLPAIKPDQATTLSQMKTYVADNPTPITYGFIAGTVTQGNDYRLSQNIRGFQVLNYLSVTFTAATDTFATSGFQVRTPAGGIYSVGVSSPVVPSGSMLLVSSTSGTYTPLSGTTAVTSLTGYLVVASVTGFNYERAGVLVVGINWVDKWITSFNTLDPVYWDAQNTDTKLLKYSKKGYRAVGYENSFSFTAATDTYAYGSIFVYTPAGGAYQVAPSSKVCASGSMLLVSTTSGSYTALSDTFSGSGTAYLIAVPRTSITWAAEGLVIAGFNFIDHWQTEWNTIDPAYWVNRATKTTADTATTDIASVRANRWNNVGATAAALGNFITKLREKTVGSNNLLNLVLWGDSIFGRLYRAEMSEASNNTNSPPGMYRQNIARSILDNFQMTSSDLKYYPVKNMTGFIGQDTYTPSVPTTFPSDSTFVTFSGTWAEFANNDFHYYKNTSTNASYVDIALEAGFSRANLIAQRSSTASTNVDVLVSVNGGAFGTVAAAGLTGSASFSLVRADGTYNTGEWQRQYRQEYSGLNTANTYTFRFTQNGTGNFWVWGMEAWETASLRVINAGRGGSTMSALKNFLYDDIVTTNYNPDGIIFELTMLNDSYVGGGTPNEAQELSTMQNLDAVLSKVADTNIPAICIIPHPSTTEPAWYEKYIQFARSYCAKYGIACIDMYAKWEELAVSGVADGTHLSDAGVTAYYEEIAKTLKADGPSSSTVKSPARIQSGLLASVGTTTFGTPYLTAPKVTITPVKDGGIVPDVYLDGNPTTTGFTVAGTGKFNWESKL